MLFYLQLPIYALLSLLRMTLAYLISVLFSLSVGIMAGKYEKAEHIIIPILDILQSIPILGFFPVAIIFFMNLFGYIGAEISSIFLIFTSQVWNMTFGVYEAVKLIPRDVDEMARVYGIGKLLYLRKILIPATMTKLIYNSAMSWGGGWFFLYASEVISVSDAQISLPGLGSLLALSLMETPPRVDMAVLSVVVIMFLVSFTYLFIWRPLMEWSENFKYEYSAGERKRIRLFEIPRVKIPPFLYRSFFRTLKYVRRSLIKDIMMKTGGFIGRKARSMRIAFTLLLAIFVVYAAVKTALSITPESISSEYIREPFLVLMASLNSIRRVITVLLISLSWALPISILVGRGKHWNEFMLIFEIAASFPVPVLWPFLVRYIVLPLGEWGFEVAAIVLALFGAQFYVLFNSLAGLRSISSDLEEMRRVFLVKGPLYLRKILIPGMFPSIVTGLITAWGGAWNTLIVAEYIKVGEEIFPRRKDQYGLGTLLSIAAWEKGDVSSVIFITAVLSLIIITINRTFWRFLYNYSTKFKVE
ncbi:MAG: ABC transporter permease subunit [Candidatus Methanodesulfokora sp.]